MEEWRSLDVQRGRGGEFVGRVERVERVDFNAEAQRRGVRRDVWPCRTCRTCRGGECESGGSVAPRRSKEE